MENELSALIQSKYEIDDEAAEALASFGHNMIKDLIQKAASSNETVEKMIEEEDEKMVNERMIKKVLAPYAEKRGPWVLSSAGDGNCATTSIAGAMEIENIIRLIIKLINEDRMPNAEDGFPALNFDRGSDVWDDGLRIREMYSRFYSEDKLDRELPRSMGLTTYTKKTEDGIQNIERPMTRRDYICLEVQQLSRQDLATLPLTRSLLKSSSVEFDHSPEGFEYCNALARAFITDSSKPGVWCGWSMFYAVVSMRNPKVPLRIYTVQNDKLIIHMDLTPDGTSLPSEEYDDVFQKDTNGFTDESDKDLYQEENEEDEEEDEEEEEEESDPLFPRILYRSGHFDVLVSDHHHNLITKFWPETAKSFRRL